MKKLLVKLVSLLPIRNFIVFESKPDISDNTKYVFEEMVKRELYKKYKLIWLVGDPESPYLERFPNTIYIKEGSIKAKIIMKIARAIISCNTALGSERRGQFSIYLNHGTTMKAVKSYYHLPTTITNHLVTSENMIEVTAYQFGLTAESAVALGYPRNDEFSRERVDLKPIFPDREFEKVVVWYPTYRQHKNGNVNSTGNALPIIHDAALAEQINSFAREKGLLIVMKPHFAQDISLFKSLNLSNIVFINDAFFREHSLSSYQFVNSCDALISDYSSIYYDFLLTDRPIGAVWEDIEEYKKFPGFAVDIDEYMKGAEKIYTAEDMIAFLDRLSRGEDILATERRQMCDFINPYKDGKNSARVVDFILSKIEK